MSRTLKRLTAALILSGSCFFLTVYWYHSDSGQRGGLEDREPIARLEGAVNEVQRRPLARMIWERVSLNDELYGGEAIRTSAHSEARIFFARSGTLIELEPESMIVLEESESGIALNFLSGNLLVRNQGPADSAAAATGTPAPQVTLRSAGQDINLQRAEVSLSADRDGEVSLEVISGEAEVLREGQSQRVAQDQRAILAKDQDIQVEEVQLRTLAPRSGTPILIDPDQREPVTFRWEPLPTGYQVYVRVGPRRGELTRVERFSARGEEGQLRIPARVGRYFWQLEARPTDQGSEASQASTTSAQTPLLSATQTLEVIPKLPPVPLEPLDKAQVQVRSQPSRVRLSWTPRARMDQLVLEVATDSQLENKVHSLYLENHQSHAEVELSTEGTYYWRLTGFIPVGEEIVPASSPLRQFELSLSAQLASPQLRSPESQQSFSQSEVQRSGLFFSWLPVPGASSYQIRIQRLESSTADSEDSESLEEFSTLVSEQVTSTSFRSSGLDAGVYRWAVVARDNEGSSSQPSEVRNLVVEGLKPIRWAHAEPVVESLYWSREPQLNVRWEKDPELEAVQWRVRMAPAGTDLRGVLARPGQSLPESMVEARTQDPFVQATVPADGRYQVVVEALDAGSQQVVARSPIKMVDVRAQPFLPAPRFPASMPQELRADTRGNIDLNWSPVPGATGYHLELLDAEGKKVLERSPQGQSTQLRQLRPGEYEVRILSLDQNQRPSQEADTRRLVVPKQSDIQAPRLRRIEVQ